MFSVHLQEYAGNKYQERKKYYGLWWNEIESRMKLCTEDEAILMRFLYGTMPVRDAGEYDFSVFLSYVKHALWLRENMEWCRELTEDIFIHHVLYYRINSEDISDCRRFFYEQLRERIQRMSIEEAVIEINYWCGEHVAYEATDGRTASPNTMFRCGKGRCGEESTFTVTAYRSVGIPARQVYTPRWAHCDDNHAWVEVYLHGEWYFIGACEPEEVLNKGWFTVPANRAILIHSRTFSDFTAGSVEECIGKEDLLSYYNNTSFYAKTKELTIKVKDRNGNVAAGACVALEILNSGEYFPVVTLATDDRGEASIHIGLGDIRVRAWKGNVFGEKAVSFEEEEAELFLENEDSNLVWIKDEWEREEIAAPKEHPIHLEEETAEQKKRKTERLKEMNHLREQRLTSFYDKDLEAAYPEEVFMFHTGGKNVEEIRKFLMKDNNPDRKLMLHNLSVKDHKDLKADILETHLDCEQGSFSDEVYGQYILCPRVYIEELTPYRNSIREYFKEEEKKDFIKNPDKIWEYIKTNITYHPEVDYKTICATPVGVLKMKEGNPLAQKVLFVAICRSLNIPARLNQVMLTPEYLKKGIFVVPEHYKADEDQPVKESVSALILEAIGEQKWNYYQTFTIGKLTGTYFETLNYEGKSFENNRLEFALEAGVYRIVTAMRMPNGNQSTFSRVFVLKDGEEKHIKMPLWEESHKDLLVNYNLHNFNLQNEVGKECEVSALAADFPVMLAFLSVGEEPTEHVLNELLVLAEQGRETALKIAIILRELEEKNNKTLQKVMEKLPDIEIYYDNEGNAEKAAASMHVDTTKLPLLILIKKDLLGVYACAGYHVGSVELISNLLKHED